MRDRVPTISGDISLHPPLNEAGISAAAAEISTATETPREALMELLTNPDSARVALYLPESWLPDETMPEYREVFLDAWWSLLGHVDQRADFVDGDIGELGGTNIRPLVNKAAHMIPMLKRHGLVTDDEVAYIAERTDSDVLKASIGDVHSSPVPKPLPIRMADISRVRQQLVEESMYGNDSPARRRWLSAHLTDTVVRDAARSRSHHDIELLLATHDRLDTQIALHALARQIRLGTVPPEESAIIERAYESTNHPDVRARSARLLRQLYHAGVIERSLLEARDIDIPRLTGPLSENLVSIQPKIEYFEKVVTEIVSRPLLSENLYPVVVIGGSRLKGYGESSADVDTVVFFRPDAVDSAEFRDAFDRLFQSDRPVEAHLIDTPAGVRLPEEEAAVGHMANDWSHVLYSMAWLGDDETVGLLRRELAADYQTDGGLRHLALRRLEQDSLQYRLMHKGYERQYVVQSDDIAIAPDAIDSQSVYWDPGYRRLATQLFAEKVRLPRVR